MKTHIIEVSSAGNFKWGKFMLMQFDHEWEYCAKLPDAGDRPLLRSIGVGRLALWIMDLQTGEGALFYPQRSSLASDDLNKHKIWVCPMYEPFMEWLYTQDLSDIKVLPHLVALGPEADKHCAMQGYRREGFRLRPGTLEFAREQLCGAIERFYRDPDEYLAVNFDKQADAELCGQPVAEFRLTATELGLDFDQIIAANQYIVADVERLKKFVARALEAKA